LKLAATIFAGALVGSAVVGGTLYLLKGGQETTTSQSMAAAAMTADEGKPSTTEAKPQVDLAPKPAEQLTHSSPTATKEEQGDASNSTKDVKPAAAKADPPQSPPTASTLEPTKSSEATPPAFLPLQPAEQQPEPAAPEPPPVATVASNKPKLTIDPLDVDPEGLDLSRLTSGAPKDPIAESHLPPEPPPKANVESAANPQPEQPAGPVAPQAVRRDQEDSVGAPAAAEPLLARKLPAVKFDKMPLCRVLDLATQISGLPVSVSPQQLRLASISSATPASADLKSATITGLLEAALKPLHLKPVVAKDQITLLRASDDKPRTVDDAVDDLAAAGISQDDLIAAIQQLVTPQSWQATGGFGKIAGDGGKLHIEQLESVQYEILLLLERSRVTLGLPTRSKYPKELIAPGAHTASVMERLAAPTTFTFTDYTPLREIFRYWQEEMQIAVLVDWPALAEERLWPNTHIACSAANKPWSAALDEVLQPLGLAWRAADHRTIEITMLQKATREPQLEVFRVKPGVTTTAEQLAARIAKLQVAGEPIPGTAAVFEPQARLLLVRQPAAVQRQIVATMGDVLELAQPAK
jgi:hypothetical protein